MPKPILSCTNREVVKGQVEARRTLTEAGCLEWLGPLDQWGYGKTRIQTSDGFRGTGAHRAAWLAIIGDIADAALQIDHLCRNRKCVNTDHMELVTNAVNSSRADHSGKAGRSGRKIGSAPGCQKHGLEHGREGVRSDGYKRWDCRRCAYDRNKAFRARRAEAKAAELKAA